jgi:hypothetical protein
VLSIVVGRPDSFRRSLDMNDELTQERGQQRPDSRA